VVLFDEHLLAPLESLVFALQLVGEVLEIWCLLTLPLYAASLLHEHCLFLLLFSLLTCVQASGVLAAALLFYTHVRDGVRSGKSAPFVAVIALKPGVCGCRLVRVALLMVLQVRLSCILRGVEAAELVEAAG
jgi:hypothetical protein